MPIVIDGTNGIVGAPGGLTSAGLTGVGYTTGSGGTVTQATSKSTAVTLNTINGQITMNNAALAANGIVTFTVNNSLISSTDNVIVSIQTGNATVGRYLAYISSILSGNFSISVWNVSAVSLSDAVVLNFAIIKGATA